MEKGFVIIDEIPKKCDGCPFCNSSFGKIVCNHQIRKIKDINIRPNWCPIKPMPERKPERLTSEYEFGNLGKAFETGWNACIKQIAGGQLETEISEIEVQK